MKIICTIPVILAFMGFFSPILAMDHNSSQLATFQAASPENTREKALEAELFEHLFIAYAKDTSFEQEALAIQNMRRLVKQEGVNIDALYASEYDTAEKKAFFNADCSYLTPLAYAIGSRKNVLIKAILDLGADVNYACSIGTPIDAAVTIGNVPVIDELVKRGADINAVDAWGQTAIFTAIYRGDKAAFDALYKYPQLNCTVRENRGHTPLHFLLLRPNPSVEIAQKLIARGSKPSDKDYDGYSPLQIATELLKIAKERTSRQPEYGPRAENYAKIVSLLHGKAIPSRAESFLANTLATDKQQERLKLKNQQLLKNKDKKKKKNNKSTSNENTGKRETSGTQEESTSPTKKNKTIEDVEEVSSPTKELRDGFGRIQLGSLQQKKLDFEDCEQKVDEIIVTEALVDNRIKDWFDNNFLRAERAKAKYFTLNEFKKSVFYHQIPMKVMNCIIKHGKPEPRASETRPDDVGKSWILKGEMVFQDPANNPWCSHKARQEGFYHCTMNSQGIIYHVGFKPKPINDHTLQFGAFLPPELQGKEHVFQGFYPGITHHFKI